MLDRLEQTRVALARRVPCGRGSYTRTSLNERKKVQHHTRVNIYILYSIGYVRIVSLTRLRSSTKALQLQFLQRKSDYLNILLRYTLIYFQPKLRTDM